MMAAAVHVGLVVVSLLVLRMGVVAVVLVSILVALLLCDPTVRTFLEISFPGYVVPDQSKARDELHAEALRGRLSDLATRPKSESIGTQGRMDLSSLPEPLRPELRALLALVRRDFIQNWYDPISFGDETFPDESIKSLEHLMAQVSMRLEQFHRANVATELSLTVLSVVVAALRRRRTEQATSQVSVVPGLWESTEARVESLRTSVFTLLSNSLPHEDRRSPAVVSMLTDILTKQIWGVLQTQSDPDVLNQYIVQYGKKSASEAITAMALGDVPSTVEKTAKHNADAVLSAATSPVDTITSTLGSAVATSVPAIAAAGEQTLGVLQEAYATLSEAAVDPGAEQKNGGGSTPGALKYEPRAAKEREHAPSQNLTNLIDLDDEPKGPLALPMDIPQGFNEPPLPPSLQDSQRTENPWSDEPNVYPPIREILASKDTDLLDAFEAYLQGTDTEANPDDRRPEGTVLLQLHANLEALTKSAQHDTTTPELFASDVRAILTAARHALPMQPVPPAEPGANVYAAVQGALTETPLTPEALRPVNVAVLARLQQLWDLFSTTQASTAVAPTDQGPTAISVVDISPNAERPRPVDPRTLQVLVSIEEASSGTGGYVVLRSWQQFEALSSELKRLYAQRPDDTVLGAPPALPSLKGKTSEAACEAIQAYLTKLLIGSEGAPAWYGSSNAVQRFVDKTRAENANETTRRGPKLMTSLGGVGRSFASGMAGAAGSARKGLGQGIGQIGATVPTDANAPIRLGTGLSKNLFGSKDRSDSSLGRLSSESTRSSLDGRPSLEERRGTPPPPLPSRGPKGAPPTLTRASDRHASATRPTPPSAEPQSRSASTADRPTSPPPVPVKESEAPPPALDTRAAETEPTPRASLDKARVSAEPPDAPLTGEAEKEAESLEPQDIDALLTAIFAIVHEAFNLQGGWTLRRGLLRVLEQVVRTTYSTSVVSTVVYFSSMLSPPALASWLATLRTTLWPDGVWKTEGAPPRTAEEKRATAEEARQVVLSYTPNQAAYAIGMGGKQTCADALATVHEIVTDPVVALDLHLALVLRVLDLATGTASGDRVL